MEFSTRQVLQRNQPSLSVIAQGGVQSWPRKSEQGDKWIFRLTAAIIATLQERS